MAGFGTCGRCGGVINGTTKRVKKHEYARYYCSTSHNISPSACAGYGIPMDALDDFVLDEVRASVTTPECLAALAAGLEVEFARHLETHKPLGPDEVATLKGEQERIEAARRGLVESIKGNPEAIALMKPEIGKLALEAAALERKQRLAKPALDKGKIKEMVERGLVFYQERVLGPMGALAPKKVTAVEGAAEDGTSGEGADAAPKNPEHRPCVPELREMLRLLGVKFTYDPDGKEGTLEFDPFG